MKKIVILIVVIFLFAFVQTASAGTQSFDYMVTVGNPLIWTCENNGIGLVRFVVDWQPVRKGLWTFHVYKEAEGGGVDPNYNCFLGEKRDKPGHWECIFTDAPVGRYISVFTTLKTPTLITETLTVCFNGLPCEYPGAR